MLPIVVGKPLSNGMRFYAHYDRVSHLSGIGVKCGSIHDPPGKSGLAHTTEHVISNESRRYSKKEADFIFWTYLGNMDKWRKTGTDRVSTFYGHEGLPRKLYMLRCFDILASFVRDQIITEDSTEAERGAVNQEYYLRGIDWMPDLMDNLMHQTIYERNPIRHRVDCEKEDLRSITIRDIRSFLRGHYVPNNMFGIVLGPSYKEAKKLMYKYFGDWEPGHIRPLDYDHSEDTPVLAEIKSCGMDRPGIHQYHVAMGYPTETYKSQDAEPLDVLAYILEKRLYRLRDDSRDMDKSVYRIEVFTRRTFVHGILYAYFATTSLDYARFGEEVIREECKRLRDEYVSDEELDMARTFLELEYIDAFTSSPGILADKIVEAVANGDEELTNLHAFPQKLHRVGKRRIAAMANKYFGESYARLVISPAI